MPDITTSLSLPSSSLSTPGQASTDDTAVLLQGLMEGLGWHDQRAGIYAAEAEQQILDQRLKLALNHYLEKQDAKNQAQLIATLHEVLEKVEAERVYALQQQAYYQAQAEHEAKAVPVLSYLGQWQKWALQGVKSFFGSTTQQLLEKYTDAASTYRTFSTQLSHCIEAFQTEETIVSLFPAKISLASLNGVNGFALDGESNGDWSGYSVSSAGDINGDGYDDVIIGAPDWGSEKGRSYVVFGGSEVGSSGSIALSSLNGVTGFKLDGESNNGWSGYSVSTAGDINDDGFADLLIGSPWYPGSNGKGRSYVIWGGTEVGTSGDMALSSLNGTTGFKLDGEFNNDYSGWSVSTAGDVNGDGYVDLIIGADRYTTGSFVGRSYVVFGGTQISSNESIALSSLNGTTGFKLDGESNNEESGWSVNTAGDVNGDGYADLIIGAPYYLDNSRQGRSYVVFGGREVGSSGSLALSSLNGTTGFKLDGEFGNDYSGSSVSTAGDLNGDGYDDLIIGAYGYPGNSFKGRSYVIFGGTEIGNSGSLALSSLNGTTGFKLDGEFDNDHSGYSVSAAGDVNGDGYDDLMIGAYGCDTNKGCTYVLLGGPKIGSSGTFALSGVDGTTGFILDGEFSNDLSGYSVRTAGDVNGDGYGDLIIGAYRYLGSSAKGRSYLVFGDVSPQLWANQLIIHAGETVILTVDNLNATGTVIPTFNISNIQHGHFEALSSLGQPVTLFNQSQISNGQIQFIHDGSQSSPSYIVQATSRIAISTLQTANVTFYRRPTLTVNQLSINQGQSLLMNSSFLNVVDDYPSNQVNFIITDLQHGQFQLAPLNNSITRFNEQQLLDGQVFFTQDGSVDAPGYFVTVSDPYFTLSPAPATVTFYHQPTIVSQFPAMISLASLNGINGFKLDGESSYDQSGYPVSIAGDINDDGYADLLIGAYGHNSYTSLSYVVFGGPQVGSDGFISLSSLNGVTGFTLSAEYKLSWISGAGDINDDGIADLLVGAATATSGAGCSYVVFGSPEIGSSGLFNLSDLNGTNGFRLDGEGGNSGIAIGAAGDINSDGYADVLIGANAYAGGKGRSYVVFGGPEVGNSGIITLSNLNGTRGFKLDGESANDYSGTSVSAAGDINGDGYDDILIGAYGYPGGSYKGRSYVVFGGPGVGDSEIVVLSSLNSTTGFVLDGEFNGDESGTSVSAGDVNGDGYVDLLVGALGYPEGEGEGLSYVVFGNPAVGNNGIVTLSSLNGSTGFKLDGESDYEVSGHSVSATGDINGDGYADVFIGANGYGNLKGRSYLVFGDISPQIWTNQLIIHAAETVILTVDNLNATGTVIPTFSISSTQHGHFEALSSPGQAVTSFNQSQVSNGQIQFVHDGSQSSPSYIVQATNRIAISTPQEANVTFYQKPTLATNQLSINQGQRVMMTSSFLNVTTEDYPADQVNFTIGNLQYGQFQLAPSNISVMQFNEQQLLAGQVFFIQDGSTHVPSYEVEVNDPYFTLPPSAAAVSFYHEPAWANNQLIINQGQSLLMTPSFLSLATEDYPPDQVNFTVTNLQYGQFQLAPLNTSVTQFTQQQLLDNQVFFIQDNSTNVPSYWISANDPYFALSPTAAAVTFYRRPAFVTNELAIHQGQSLLMTSSLLNITSEDYPSDQVIFTVTDLEHGQFQLAPLNTSVMEFSEQHLLASQVFFTQDNTASSPSYLVTLSDPYFTLPPTVAVVTFYRQPTLVNNQLIINEGQTVLMTSAFLSIANEDYPPDQVNLTISNLQYGRFQLAPLNTSMTQFSEQQLLDNQVFFSHNGSINPPTYQVGVTDPYFVLSPTAADVTFYRRPTLVNNQLIINQGQKLLMESSWLDVVEDYPPDQVTFMISDLQYGQFQLISSNNSIAQFSQQQLLANQIFFIQNNSTSKPSYQVSVQDPYFTLSPVSAAVTFYRQPVLEASSFSICQGEGQVMTSDLLDATDDYPPSQVVFTVSDIQHAYFELLPNIMGVSEFTQQQLLAKQVVLVQDGSANPPSYQISLSDPYFTLSPVTINTTLSCTLPSSSSNTSIKMWIIIASSAGAVLLSALGCLLWRHYQQKKKPSVPSDAADSEKKSTLSSPLLPAVPESHNLVRSSSSLRQENLRLTALSTPISINALSLPPASLESGFFLRPPISLVTMPVRHEQKTIDEGVVQEDKPLMKEAGEFKISFTVKWEDLKFREKDKLGTGAYGTVYKGTYKFNEVAIKKLHAEHFSGAALTEFKQEVNIMANMHSDYIVSLRGVCLESPHFCIVMELMPKGSLYHLLQNSPELPLPVLYRMALDIGYGLYHLHEAGILHRDLKSLNVLLDDRLRAKLTDFGLSKVKSEVETLSSAKSMKGTLGWMAPELFEEKASATQAADMYAYGMILWELMIRPYRTPFKGLAPAAMMSAKLSRGEKQETLPEKCPPKYSELIRWCWQTPQKRPSAKQASERLCSFWEESTKQAKSTSASSAGLSEFGPDSGVPLIINSKMVGS